MLLEVLSGTKRLASGSPENEASGGGIPMGFFQGILKIFFHLLIEGVVDIGAIQRDGADALVDVIKKCLVSWHDPEEIEN